jgi:hypothetical protein
LQKKFLINKTSSLVAATAFFFLTVFLLTLPGEAFPTDGWMDKIWMLDKWVHIGLFGALVALWCMVRKFSPAKKLINSFIWIGIGGLAYGVIMEFVQQYYVVHRSFEFGDILADAGGCIAGVAFSWWRYIKK